MPQLEVCPSVIDFGDLVCEHQITCQSLTLTNTGSKKGNFMFLVDQLPSCFKVLPTQWTLLPGEAVDVKVTSILFYIWVSALIILHGGGHLSQVGREGGVLCKVWKQGIICKVVVLCRGVPISEVGAPLKSQGCKSIYDIDL